MKVLLIGSGGREHAIAWKLSQSARVERIYVAPGNGGTATLERVENVAMNPTKENFSKIAQFAKDHQIGLVVVGPEEPLVHGITEVMKGAGIPCFGPSEKASIIEAEKSSPKIS